MKHLLLFLALLFSTKSIADTVQSLNWNTAGNTFNAITKQNGTKQIGDYSYGSFVANTTSALTTTVTISYVRIGKQVTLTWPTIQGTCGVGALVIATQVPVSLRPSSANIYSVHVLVRDSAADQATPGMFQITATGSMNFYRNGSSASFTATNCGPYAGSFTYTI